MRPAQAALANDLSSFGPVIIARVTADLLRSKLEALAPDRDDNPASAIALADACYALEADFSQVLDVPAPDPAARPALRQLALELLRAWIPRIDRPTLAALEPRVRDRRMPIDLKARKAELKQTRLPDRTQVLAPYAELPPLAGWSPIAAFYVDEWLAIGEHPAHGLTLDAEPGVWLAYGRGYDLGGDVAEASDDDEDDDDTGPSDEMLAVHAAHLGRVEELLARARQLPDRLPIDAARMVIADDGAVKDEDLVEALWDNEEEGYRGHAAQVFLGGDGHATVRNATLDGRSVLVIIDLY